MCQCVSTLRQGIHPLQWLLSYKNQITKYWKFETKLPDEVTLPRSLSMIILSISYIWSDTVMYNVYVGTTLSNLAAPVLCVVCVLWQHKDFITQVKKEKRLETLPLVHILTQ